ncbi:hypothetical protein FRC03_009345 [Tulasnella sp. 419]|nr:hypothetical protein FRC03_009345 [Tulasnella sp. 419]
MAFVKISRNIIIPVYSPIALQAEGMPISVTAHIKAQEFHPDIITCFHHLLISCRIQSLATAFVHSPILIPATKPNNPAKQQDFWSSM